MSRLWAAAALGAMLLSMTACASLPAPDKGGDQRLAGLPLVETRAQPGGDTFAVLYSGDGGWAAQPQGFASGLAAKGVPVVGVSAVRYLIHRKTPEQAAADLTAIIDHYGVVWDRPRVIVVGYSFGGDAVPFIVEGLAPEVLKRVELVVLISPTDFGDLAFRGLSWFDWRWPAARPLTPALKAIAGRPILCIYATHDPREACERFPHDLVRTMKFSGGHRYEGHWSEVAAAIVEAAPPR